MKNFNSKARLCAGAASFALITALGASEAEAQCTTTGTTVTCAGTVTANDVNAATNSVPPPSVTIRIAPAATVTQPSNFIFPSNTFNGAVDFGNAGTVGSTAAPVGFAYNGTPATATNTLSITNSGIITGQVFASGVGGPITATNTGTLAGGLNLFGSGAITLTSSGPIYITGGAAGNTAVQLQSFRSVTTTTGAVGTDGLTTTTVTGGPVTATITGPVAVPAAGGNPAVPQAISLFSVGGAQLSLNAVAGQVTVNTANQNSSSIPGGGNVATAGGTTTTTNANSNTAIGAAASATLGTDGRATSVSVNSGPGGSTVSIAGIVASAAAPNSVNATSTSVSTTNNSQSTNSATNSTFTQTNTQTPVGGATLIDIVAGGQVFGSATANSNAGAATVNVAGTVGAGSGVNVTTQGNVLAQSQGTPFTNTQTSSNTFATGDFRNNQVQTQSAGGAAARATVASTGAVFGSVTARGDGGATIDNAGRIRDNAQVFSSRTITTAFQSGNSQVTTAGAGGASTVVNSSSNSNTNTTVGGTGSLTNRAGATIEDNAQITSVGNATIDNSGAIFGNVSVLSSGFVSTSANSSTGTVTTTPATAGGNTVRNEQVSSSSSSSTPNGGTATGTYSGTVGAVAGSALSGFRTVTQSGQAGSTATIAGTMFADVSVIGGGFGSTASNNSSTVTVTQPAVAPATPASETVTTTSSRNTGTVQAGNATVTLTGAIRDNGSGTGDLFATAQGGAATVTVTGGRVEGLLQAVGGNNTSTSSGTDFTQRSTTAGTAAGPQPADIPQSSTSTNFNESRGVAGSATVTLTNGTVTGGLTAIGRGTGAGTVGASATVGAGSIVGGTLNVSTATGFDQRTDSSTINTRTAANAVNQVNQSSTVQTVAAAAGNADATIAGQVGSASIVSPWGNATASLTGQVTSGGISLFTNGQLNNSSSETRFAGTSTTGFVFPNQTGSTSSSSQTYRGGTAALTINSSAALQTAGTSAVNGQINVSGLGGATLGIAANTRVLQTNAAGIFVASQQVNTTNTQTSTFTGGVQSGQVTTTTSTNVGGAASVTNAGIVGATTGFFGSPTSTNVIGLGGASLTNSGSIFGSVTADALFTDSTTTTTGTGLTDAVNARTVSVQTLTGVGGVANVTNSGVISGPVFASGVTGTVANSGVLRNGVSVGEALTIGTRTQTATATSSTLVAAAPVTPFTQTYTINQNALLIGGVNVAGATIADPSTNAAATATLRTSNIVANVNLNSGSVTTGNIVAQRTPDAAATRLTNTTVTLAGTGTLGIGTSDVPSAALGTGAGPLRFSNTANFATFAATDPALGSSASGTFVPSQFIASGSRVLGATLVEKTGAGVFTVVGSPYLAPTNGNALATYTMDVGTFRISGGEVQLGVSGADGSTGASIFGIRGNVENNATLLLGRRVTDGTTSVVQGTAVRVDGNFTQSSTGTLQVAVAPALVRSNGTVVGALPAEGVLGFGGFGVGLTPFVAFDPTTNTALRSTPSSLTVNGNATLAGSISLAATPGAIYTAGRAFDLITVSGTYNGTGLTVTTPTASPFVRFTATPRTVGTSTVVSVDVTRTAYATVAANSNAAAAAAALDAAIPNVVTAIRAIPNPNAVTDVQSYARLQDLATVIAGLDTQLSAADAATAFNQLGSGSVYGSLLAVSTTAPFGEAVDTPTGGEAGVGLWLRPAGSFARFDGSNTTGAGDLKADNYGGVVGLAISTGNEGTFGIAGGYGRIDARDRAFPSKASADTYMVGVYGRQRIGGLDLAAQAVFGWSNWDTTRTMSVFSRTATADFDSQEFRISGRVGYDVPLGGAVLQPFGKIEARHYKFDAFSEQNAGGIGLAVAERSRTVFSPEAGLRLGGEFGGVRPFAEASYVFQGDVRADRDVAYLGSTATTFRLQGVDPEGYAKLSAGITADYHGASFSLRGNYLTGGGNQAGEIMGGVALRF